MHFTYIGQVERGERDVSLTTIPKLARRLSVDASALLAEMTTEVNPFAVSPRRKKPRKREPANGTDAERPPPPG